MTKPKANTYDDPLMSTKAVSQYLDVPTKTLEYWRWTGDGPPFVRMTARKIRYQRSVVDAWLEINTFESTSGYGNAENL